MAMSKKKVGRMVTADVDKALANIDASTPKPKMETSDELKKATGPSRDMTRSELFRYTRMAAKAANMDPSKQTFSYKGKTYHTRTAEEESAMRRSRSGTGATAPKGGNASSGAATPSANTGSKAGAATSSANTGANAGSKAGAATSPKIDKRYLGVQIPSASQQRDTLASSIERRNKLVAPQREPTRAERMRAKSRADVAAWNAKKAAEARAEANAERVAKAKRDAEARRKYAAATRGSPLRTLSKGGKIDGAALRGKTRAMKKGK